MRKIIFGIFAFVFSITLLAVIGTADAAQGGKFAECDNIQSGEIVYSAGHYLAGEPISIGYDEYGYNYQATRFQGSYANVYLGKDGYPPYTGDYDSYLADNPGAASHWAWPYRDINIILEWNDAWLSNRDCDGDHSLDRHRGYTSYIGSGAWETNHMWGVNDDGSKWNYFTKIVAAPADAYPDSGIWYTADGIEIGPVIWNEFATTQEVSNDPYYGDHGILYNSPFGPGFGKFK